MNRDELKLLQMGGQHLLRPAEPHAVVQDLCGLQAQFLSNAMHALRIRSAGEQTGELVKNWTIRGTMHVFAQEDLPLFLHEGRSHFLRPRDTLEGDDCITKARKRYFADLIVQSVCEGVSLREDLKAACTAAGMTEREAESVFDPWGGTIRALCESGVLCHKVQEKKAFMMCPRFEPMERSAAELELARRYFTHYGPATQQDAAYFFGTTQTRVRAWLAQLPVQALTCEGKTYYLLDRERDLPAKFPDCIFLAGFDPLLLGYEKRQSLYLPPEYLRNIFSMAGIFMPAILLHGRVAGRWKRKGRRVDVTLFRPVPAADSLIIRQTAQTLWPDAAVMGLPDDICCT